MIRFSNCVLGGLEIPPKIHVLKIWSQVIGVREMVEHVGDMDHLVGGIWVTGSIT